ncbi:hypothetical protein ACRAWF_36740 [Streptomyces sp. L7]
MGLGAKRDGPHPSSRRLSRVPGRSAETWIDAARQQVVDSPRQRTRDGGGAPAPGPVDPVGGLSLRGIRTRRKNFRSGPTRSSGANEGAEARTSVHHNINSQVVITGGGINASGGFHYRAPEGGR